MNTISQLQKFLHASGADLLLWSVRDDELPYRAQLKFPQNNKQYEAASTSLNSAIDEALRMHNRTCQVRKPRGRNAKSTLIERLNASLAQHSKRKKVR